MCVEYRTMRRFYQKTVISGVIFWFLVFSPVFPLHAMTQSTPLTKALYFKGIEKVAQPEFLEKFNQGADKVKILVLLKDHENYKVLSVVEDVVLMKEVTPDIQTRQDRVNEAAYILHLFYFRGSRCCLSSSSPNPFPWPP